MPQPPTAWQIWIDTGGTFTDCLAVSPGGETRRAKVLSSGALRGVIEEAVGPARFRVRLAGNDEDNDLPADFLRGFVFRRLDDSAAAHERTITGFDPASGVILLAEPMHGLAPGALFEARSPDEAPVLAARLVTRTPPHQPLPAMALRLATTRGTNALLTRQGARVALFVTKDFGDLLEIGTQQRPDLFALDIVKPTPLYESVVEVPDRVAADGTVLIPLDVRTVTDAAQQLLAAGVDVAAVALMHGFRHPAHERELARLLRGLDFRHVSLSCDLAPFIKLLPRAQTTVVNAYLAPVIENYRERVTTVLPNDATLHVMTSAGGLVRPESFHPKDSLLSGPAGGVVGAALAGRKAGFERILAFDMGGTSTDVARVENNEYEYLREHTVGEAVVVAPALAIESVAAGGGSVCAWDPVRGLRVGPESANAHPGPACYGAGGPLTLTDVNLLLGRLDAARFPLPINRPAAEAAADALAAQTGLNRDELLNGLLAIANERMADAIAAVSTRRGDDPRDHALVTFGGAGGQHACAVAARLGITTVLVPPDAGLLSARGIGHAAIERFAESGVLAPLDELGDAGVTARLDELANEAIRAVAAEGVPLGEIVLRRRIVYLRFAGQDSSLAVEQRGGPNDDVPLAEAFARRYLAVYGHQPAPGRIIEIESLRVVASSSQKTEPVEADTETRAAAYAPAPAARLRACFGAAWRNDVPAFERAGLHSGARVTGPAVVFEAHSTSVIEPGWEMTVDDAGALILTAPALTPVLSPKFGSKEVRAAAANPVALELFANRFRAVADEMGEMLRRTALSTNVKERLDFSCALMGPDGALVAAAAHIPVHLGALGLCVRRVRDVLPLGPGDVAVTNHPGWGGSHLPDVTVITPVFEENVLLGYVASRAHHAEIGGARPGSMPPNATTLIEEGVVIAPTYLVRGGVARFEAMRALLTGGTYPSRAPDDNLADLEAALAANRRGADALCALARAHGAETVQDYMAALTDRAERLLRATLSRLPARRYAATERLDDGTPLCVAVTIEESGAATIDFAGTGATHGGNLNATPAIVQSAVLYVLRLLVSEPLPLNEGLLRAVTLNVPSGTLLNPVFDPNDPARCPAVVGGNTETSQRLVDTLLKAFGLAAGSQGTMNNVLWGNDAFGYYETICGGAGATKNAPGAHAVHTHMTNTRITDPEIMETRYPVRVERFAVRRESGGAGRHAGGDGVIREVTFLASVAVSVLTQHRREGPYGLAGGEDGKPGAQRIVRADGSVLELGSIDGCDVSPGDRLIVETPGGGGWGTPGAGDSPGD